MFYKKNKQKQKFHTKLTKNKKTLKLTNKFFFGFYALQKKIKIKKFFFKIVF